MCGRPSFASPLSEDVQTDALKKIYSPEAASRHIIDKYGLFPWQIRIQNKHHDIKFIVILPNDPQIVNMMRADLEKLGYYLGTEMDVYYQGRERYRGYIFEPYHQKEESANIRRYGCLYHVTPVTNLESILKRGLIPHSSDYTERFAYPERVYMVEGSHDPDTLCDLAKVLYINKRRRNKHAESKYAIITLDIKSIPADIPMYYDGNYEYGVFVEKNIPADTIISIEIYDCEKQRFVNYGVWDKLKSKILSLFKK